MACLSHAQDINLFRYYKRYPLPVYLDIDFLQLIFASGYNFMYQKGLLGSYRRRIKGHELYCRLIHRLSPLLTTVPLNKRGYYTPKEAVKDPRWVFLGKRLFREMTARQKYPVNFSLDDWMKQYADIQLEILRGSGLIRNFINVEALIKQFNNNNHKTYEKYWRKFTNPIFFGKLFDFYLTG